SAFPTRNGRLAGEALGAREVSRQWYSSEVVVLRGTPAVFDFPHCLRRSCGGCFTRLFSPASRDRTCGTRQYSAPRTRPRLDFGFRISDFGLKDFTRISRMNRMMSARDHPRSHPVHPALPILCILVKPLN